MTPEAPEHESEPVVPLRSDADAFVPVSERRYEDEEGADEGTDDTRMSLGDHLTELRSRLIVCLTAFAVVFLVGLFLYRWLWHAIRLPLLWTAEMMQCSTEQSPTASNTGATSGGTVPPSKSSETADVRPKASRARTPRRINSSTTRAISSRGRPSAIGAGSVPIEVSSTASAETGPVGKRCARGTARGGAYST